MTAYPAASGARKPIAKGDVARLLALGGDAAFRAIDLQHILKQHQLGQRVHGDEQALPKIGGERELACRFGAQMRHRHVPIDQADKLIDH